MSLHISVGSNKASSKNYNKYYLNSNLTIRVQHYNMGSIYSSSFWAGVVSVVGVQIAWHYKTVMERQDEVASTVRLRLETDPDSKLNSLFMSFVGTSPMQRLYVDTVQCKIPTTTRQAAHWGTVVDLCDYIEQHTLADLCGRAPWPSKTLFCNLNKPVLLIRWKGDCNLLERIPFRLVFHVRDAVMADCLMYAQSVKVKQ